MRTRSRQNDLADLHLGRDGGEVRHVGEELLAVGLRGLLEILERSEVDVSDGRVGCGRAGRPTAHAAIDLDLHEAHAAPALAHEPVHVLARVAVVVELLALARRVHHGNTDHGGPPYGSVERTVRAAVATVKPAAQKRPRARSRAGRFSRQVVHQPVRSVSANSGGRPSASTARAAASWSYATDTNSTSSSGVAVSSAYQTSGVPSFSGRPTAPTFTAWAAPPLSARLHLSPVCVQSSTSAACSASRRRSSPSGVVDSQRNSLIRRGEP